MRVRGLIISSIVIAVATWLGCGAMCDIGRTLMACGGSILFSLFIVYDTNRICCDEKYIDNW